MNLSIRPLFSDGALVSCPPGIRKRCQSRCDLPLSPIDRRCVVSHPGFQRATFTLPANGPRDTAPGESISLKACSMSPGEECEPALSAGLLVGRTAND